MSEGYRLVWGLWSPFLCAFYSTRTRGVSSVRRGEERVGRGALTLVWLWAVWFLDFAIVYTATEGTIQVSNSP